MFLMRMAALAVITTGVLNLAPSAAAVVIKGTGSLSSSEFMQETVLRDMIADSTVGHAMQRRDAVHRCYEPASEVGPVPSADDCLGAIKQLRTVQADITVKLVEGCYHAVSGNCTASVCPQRIGTSTISPALAAQYLSDSVMSECISKGHRGCCYTYVHMQRPRDADMFEDFCKDKLPDDDIYVPPHHQPINPEDEDDVVPDQHAAFGIQKATQRNREAAWKDLGLAELMGKGPAVGKSGGAGRASYKGLPR
ncbi:Apc13p protein-domain-containing protein [Daldinia loculata]|nr:Apc13p protein-domain-containing protein [Daldinia loculata]